jgi:hypothetical protein
MSLAPILDGAGILSDQSQFIPKEEAKMKKTCLALVSGLAFGGAGIVNAPYAWSDGQRESSERQVQQPADYSTGGERSGPGQSGMSRRDTHPGTAGNQHWSKDKVKEIQEALKDKGFDPGAADGVIGPETNQAIREFQKSNNLQVTGRIDEKTAGALGVDGSGMGGSTSSVHNDPSGRQQESGNPSESTAEKTGAKVPAKGLGSGRTNR